MDKTKQEFSYDLSTYERSLLGFRGDFSLFLSTGMATDTIGRGEKSSVRIVLLRALLPTRCARLVSDLIANDDSCFLMRCGHELLSCTFGWGRPRCTDSPSFISFPVGQATVVWAIGCDGCSLGLMKERANEGKARGHSRRSCCFISRMLLHQPHAASSAACCINRVS